MHLQLVQFLSEFSFSSSFSDDRHENDKILIIQVPLASFVQRRVGVSRKQNRIILPLTPVVLAGKPSQVNGHRWTYHSSYSMHLGHDSVIDAASPIQVHGTDR